MTNPNHFNGIFDSKDDLLIDLFLISELIRFKTFNGRSPYGSDFDGNKEYPSTSVYKSRLGGWNKAKILAGDNSLQFRQKWRTGKEMCNTCNNIIDLNSRLMQLPNGNFQCNKCYQNIHHNSDYKIGNLDPDSTTGFGFIGQRIAAKALNLELKHDCNCSVGFNHPYDLYSDKYGRINVKSAKAKGNSPSWQFNFKGKPNCDMFIFIGFNHDRSKIEFVYFIKTNEGVLTKKGLNITKNSPSVVNHKKYEVKTEPFNKALGSMNIKSCQVLRND